VQSQAYQQGHNKTHNLSMVSMANKYAAEIAALGPIAPRVPQYKKRVKTNNDNALLCQCGQDKTAPLGEHAEWCDRRRAPVTVVPPVSKKVEQLSLQDRINDVQSAKALYEETKADLIKLIEDL